MKMNFKNELIKKKRNLNSNIDFNDQWWTTSFLLKTITLFYLGNPDEFNEFNKFSASCWLIESFINFKTGLKQEITSNNHEQSNCYEYHIISNQIKSIHITKLNYLVQQQ
ncbi:hypothetical protein PPL_02254 [Heterostelium album PN500]|uniref:Uncharacterized protein n=1 Tax=Heterostelium pallidum (strain ATCC 26659 / Pp 5 / PN500) TaxID=670386 RepID=D3B1T0_HETP5|nr:hypothetical protein PPL_02254 [Heterostelium album PN500]EFA85254.1 hypothetical protein PPL_02254 [Heterostelium album PN500]|eukprot:XP_020437363.1 hypothetical protein PPL_02254 [Heterostelium album PN500]